MIKQKGFTLIETFVAITILLIVVLGPMGLLSSALSDATSIKEQVIAGYLAQEGVELVMSYHALCSSGGMFDYINSVGSSQAIEVDGTLSTCSVLISNGGPSSYFKIKQDPGNKRYGTNGNPTIFDRQVLLTRIDNREIDVTSSVKINKGKTIVYGIRLFGK